MAAALGGQDGAAAALDAVAEAYVKLVLAVHPFDNEYAAAAAARHAVAGTAGTDPAAACCFLRSGTTSYVDAYIGPAEWREAPPIETTPEGIAAHADRLLRLLEAHGHPTPPSAAEVEQDDDAARTRLRGRFLYMQLRAVGAYARQLAAKQALARGEAAAQLPFDEEADLLYGARAPTDADAHFERILADLDQLLPGTGTLAQRYTAFKARYIIPPERLDAVFRAAVDETRRRTRRHIPVRPGSPRPGRRREGAIRQRALIPAAVAPSVPAFGRTRAAARERELHHRVRDQQAVERVQLLQGQLPLGDPDQHGLAHLHRPRGGPRRPRG